MEYPPMLVSLIPNPPVPAVPKLVQMASNTGMCPQIKKMNSNKVKAK